MSFPVGTALTALFNFTKNGVLTDPVPAPTIVNATYPDTSLLAPIPALTHVRTGQYSATVFTAGQVTATGPYQALAYTSDTTIDNFASQADWEVETAAVATDPLTAAVPGAYASGTAGWALGLINSIYNTVLAILVKVSSQATAFISPVATNQDTEIYTSRDFQTADGLELSYTTNITIYNTDTFSWNAGPIGAPWLQLAGVYVDANHLTVSITRANAALLQTGHTGFEVTVTRAGRVIQAIAARLTVGTVIVA